MSSRHHVHYSPKRTAYTKTKRQNKRKPHNNLMASYQRKEAGAALFSSHPHKNVIKTKAYKVPQHKLRM
jgi:hypothetical protein